MYCIPLFQTGSVPSNICASPVLFSFNRIPDLFYYRDLCCSTTQPYIGPVPFPLGATSDLLYSNSALHIVMDLFYSYSPIHSHIRPALSLLNSILDLFFSHSTLHRSCYCIYSRNLYWNLHLPSPALEPYLF
jgi:hypothetical protein